MNNNQDFIDFINSGDKLFPCLSIDCVIFGFHDNQLKILLLKFKNTDFFALPGGFIDKDENIDDAAKQVLKKRTGLENIYLEQFYTFGETNRVDIEIHKTIMLKNGVTPEPGHWLLQRFVTVGYYALVDFSKAVPTPDLFSDAWDWYDINEMPPLAFDHENISRKALETLRLMLDFKLIGFNLLPETFTMAELQSLYETILGKKLIRANFQRKILSLEILERLDKKWSGGAHKAPYLYRFDEKKAKDFLEGKTLY
ncbi:ADP-ribose pyrophosphatase YjhB, NUDIX family [Pseudarcicella hirudinis]|uniref:ADP-ribose pyrophosphatase YjhB, NUDIX family n=1 Tax=Pseudarcicella hirudinis TaxID=1079859 RepID=A0A1I5VCI1_9BACT|nr:NUDIX domain-containing protein [Pseudarcicella hirudinis]SFQ05185.1 ADP-ribose pyrophosphatase YjhB, NUDIX family [Pseudarcicella hirudinis]